MSGAEILIGVLLGLLVNEFCDVSPWAARKLVRWSAHRRYVNPARADARAEELARLIDDRPGKLFKLITALGFVSGAVMASARRTITRRSATTPEEQPVSNVLGLPAAAIDRTPAQIDLSYLPNRSGPVDLGDIAADFARGLRIEERRSRRVLSLDQRLLASDRPVEVGP